MFEYLFTTTNGVELSINDRPAQEGYKIVPHRYLSGCREKFSLYELLKVVPSNVELLQKWDEKWNLLASYRQGFANNFAGARDIMVEILHTVGV